jgi:hypothetical protein
MNDHRGWRNRTATPIASWLPTALALVALCLAVALVSWAPAASASTHVDLVARSNASTRTVPGDNFFAESIAGIPDGSLFVSSIVTGAILRFRPGSSTAETFVPAGVNASTAGVLVDVARGVLWACAVYLNFQTPTALRASDLGTGALPASYELPDRGICADITLAHGRCLHHRYHGSHRGHVAARSDPAADDTPADAGRRRHAVRLVGGPAFHPPGAFRRDRRPDQRDRLRRQLHPVHDEPEQRRAAPRSIRLDGSAAHATIVDLDRDLVVPDGIRMLDPARLLVTELGGGRLTLVNVRTRTTAVVDDSLDQPTSVVRVGGSLWVNEGQVLRLFSGQPPNLSFKVQRLSAPTLPPGQSWSEVEVDAAIRLIGEEPDRDQHSRAAEAPNAGEAVVTRRLIRR